jgi:hypothetical protein
MKRFIVLTLWKSGAVTADDFDTLSVARWHMDLIKRQTNWKFMVLEIKAP